MATEMEESAKREQLTQLFSRELGRFSDVVDAIDRTGSLAHVQSVFTEINARLRAAKAEEREAVLEVFVKTVGDTLFGRGASEEIVRDIQRNIRHNWLALLESGDDPDVGMILRKTVSEWEKARTRLMKEQKSFKDLWMGAVRLTTGGGVVVFDAAKLLLVLPAPAYLFASFISGAILFMNGVDQLWGRQIDRRT